MLAELKQKIAHIVASSKVAGKKRNKRITGATLSFERLESRKFWLRISFSMPQLDC